MVNKLKLILSILLIAAGLQAQSKAELIDNLMQRYYDYNQFHGSVLVADEDGVVYKKSFGLANVEWNIPNTTDTKFRLGSITKQFTSMLIMQLVESGELNLDDKLSDMLPYYRNDTGEKVTLHQLLTHTSGIPSYTSLPEFGKEISRNHYDVKEFVKKYCSNDLDFEPGTSFSYNNSGYFLLGAIIEQKTGKTYEQVVKENIFDPLEMNNSGYDHHRTIIDKRATGYNRSFTDYENSEYLDMSIPYSAGSLYSTVEDLYKWDRALKTNKLLSEKYKEIMFTPYEEAYGAHYAYGWVIGKKLFEGAEDSLAYTQHGGDINGFSSYLIRIPEKDQFVVLLNNVRRFPRSEIADNILKILNGLEYDYPKQGISFKMLELINEEGIEEAADTYKLLKDEEEDAFLFDVRELNNLGYYLLNNDRLNEAIKVFELNVEAYPDNSNVFDSLGEAYMKNGNNESAITNYKKSLELNPGNDYAVEKLKELGVEPGLDSMNVSHNMLVRYTGKYELMPNFILTVTVEEDRIFAQATGQPQFEIFPKSETEFYLKVVDAQIEFLVNDNGEAESLILFQNGREVPGKKIE